MHKPVLLKEVLENIKLKDGSVFLDATVGGGGHSEALLKVSKGNITLIGIDEDNGALSRVKERLSGLSQRIILRKANFRNIDKVLKDEGIEKVDAVLADLGFSSNQIEESGRGFSFLKNEPLLMTLDDRSSPETITARDIVNNFDEANLETIIKNYGEEKNSRRIARAIVEERKIKKIETSAELSELIKRACPRHGKINPATKTFQALRIAVNDELGALPEFLPKAIDSLKSGGRLAVISFHSLEDRIVKNFGKTEEKKGLIKILTKKPIVAEEEERLENPRSRSAKLRIFEKK